MKRRFLRKERRSLLESVRRSLPERIVPNWSAEYQVEDCPLFGKVCCHVQYVLVLKRFFAIFWCSRYTKWWITTFWFSFLQRSHTMDCSRHGLANYTDTKAKCRHLKKLICKGTVRQVFFAVYRLEIQLVMRIFFDPALWTVALYPSLWFNSPPPPSLCE